MKKPRVESYDSSEEENSSDEEVNNEIGLFFYCFVNYVCFQLREAFRKGIIKPGLNIQVGKEKTFANNIVSSNSAYSC